MNKYLAEFGYTALISFSYARLSKETSMNKQDIA
jgi:hypothetical protein